VAGLVGAWSRRGSLDLGVRGTLSFGGAGGRVAQCRHGGGQLLEGRVHPLKAVAEGEQVGGDSAEVVLPEERVDLAGIEGVGGRVEGHGAVAGAGLAERVRTMQSSCARDGVGVG
jgi:hypothetical protein